jgi:hypothetical protein
MQRETARFMMNESVVENLVIGVGKAVLLKLRLVIPVHLCEKEEMWVVAANVLNRPRPPGISKGLFALGAADPGARKDLRLYEHCHVAPNSRASSSDSAEFSYHSCSKIGIEKVELECVGPPRIMGIFSERRDIALR